MSLDPQLPDLRASLDNLNPTPKNFNLPKIDSETLSYTYPVSAEFVSLTKFMWRFESASINGAGLTFRDDSLGSAGAPLFDHDVDDFTVATFGRYYQRIQIQLNGGAVTPILVFVSLLTSDAGGTLRGYEQTRDLLTNPGVFPIGPVHAPPGTVLNITVGAGGVGDLATIRGTGLAARAGTPLPLIPGITGGETT